MPRKSFDIAIESSSNKFVNVHLHSQHIGYCSFMAFVCFRYSCNIIENFLDNYNFGMKIFVVTVFRPNANIYYKE